MYRVELWGALWKVWPPVDKIGPAKKFPTEAEARAYVASMTGEAPAPTPAPVFEEEPEFEDGED